MINKEIENKIEKFLNKTFPLQDIQLLEAVGDENNENIYYVYINDITSEDDCLDTFCLEINFQNGSSKEIDEDLWEKMRDKELNK